MAGPGRPSKIGKYEVVEVLGEGGMGAVYKAIDPRIGRIVAIKVIKGDFAEDPELRRRFDVEARAVGNLQHPNIVTVFDFGEENGSPYLVMQYLDGTPLDKIIAHRQNLPIIQKLDIIIGVLRALDYAHEHGVIHRDVKPANVHVLKDGSVKLLDFGIARQGDFTLTHTGQVMGTMFYMPPEQMNGEVVDRRGDIFSTGIMLFELLTYSLPFDARDQTAIIVQRLKGDPPPPLSKYFENYPIEMDDIIARAMTRDRDERYSRAEDFAFDLMRVQEKLKRDMASHFVDQARALIAKSDLKKARELLSEVVKIDTQNSTAKQLLYDVLQLLQKEQRVEKIHQLRKQAEDALAAKQLDEAANLVEQAIKVDKSDTDLLELREQVQEAKSRALQVKKLLNFAIAAQQSDQFEVAQKAVADALALDGSDTDAKVMQAAIARQLVEHEKRNRVQQLLQVARREISARQYDAARENISKAKAIDPAHPEIPGLDKMVLAGQEQEKRRLELQQVCTEIERRLVENNLAAARDLAASAMRKFPGEERLVKLKAATDEAYEQQERRNHIEQNILSASRLVDEGQASSALTLLQDAERVYPTDTRLQEYLKVVREAAAREAAEQERKGILIRAGAAIRRKSFAEAIDTLERGLVRFPADAEIQKLLDTSRQEFDRLTQKKQVEEVSRQARQLLETRAHTDAISLLERSVAQVSDPDLIRLLEYARKQAADYRAGIKQATEQASQMLDDGRHSEALKFLEAQVESYGKSAEFQALLNQTRAQVEGAQQARQTVRRDVEQARSLLRSGELHGAETIAHRCQLEAPSEPEVMALAIEIHEEMKAVERRRQEETERRDRETQQRAAEAERATRAEVDTLTKKFPGSVEPQFPPVPGPAPPSVRGTFSTSIGTGPQGRAPTEWLQEAGAQVTERPPNLEEYEPAEVEAPAEPVVWFPPPVEPELRREIQPAEPRKSKQVMLIAVVATLILVAGVVAWFIFHGGKPTEAYLKITGAPAGALYRVGDKTGSIGSDGTATIPVKPGPATVDLDAPRYEHYSKSGIEAKPGETASIPVVMTPEPVTPVVMGTLAIKSKSEYADVWVNNKYQDQTGKDGKFTIQLLPDWYEIQLKKNGSEDSPIQRVEIVAGMTKDVSFPALKKSEIPPPPPSEASIVIKSDPGARVRVNGEDVGTIGPSGQLGLKKSVGDYSVEVTMPGRETFEKKITAVANQRLVVIAKLPPPPLLGPNIVSFIATPSTIKNGEKTQLKWDTQRTTEISIDHDVGTSRSSSGAQEVHPTETTIYTLTARGTGEPTSKSVTVTVNPLPASLPSVSSFKATPDTVQQGDKITLSWATQNATKVSIEPIEYTGGPNSETVITAENTGAYTYVLTARGPGGESPTSRLKVTVRPKTAPPPPIDDTAAIKKAIERYRVALESEEITQLQGAWPTIGAKAKGFETQFHDVKDLKVNVSCPGDPKMNGDKAEWSCSEAMTGKSRKSNDPWKVPPSKITFILTRNDAGWHLQDLR